MKQGRMKARVRYWVVVLLWATLLLANTSAPCLAAPSHTIDARFDPAARTLAVTATLILPGGQGGHVVTLAPTARDLRLAAGNVAIAFQRAKDTVRFHTPPGTSSIRLDYVLPLDAPPEELPVSMDNPGALASDAVSGADWAMLMPASLWHPLLAGRANAYHLRLSAPSGIKAVTQGTLGRIDDQDGQTVSTWDIAKPVGRLGLCLAPYTLSEARDAPALVQTFLLAQSNRLAATYLAASAKYLRFYTDLHGPYAFTKFAVAENPLPTGYGLPSYTLLGSQVIALPFIPATSLRHEIAHSWWGNGVLVDDAGGNWCEGLTTYVADYLAKEEESPQAAREYRLKTLRAFAALAGQGQDMPLDRFGGRFSPASQAVGYGKAMYVFHMLRGFVGEAAFWQGLRQLYAARLFKPTSWEDIRRVYAGLPGFDAARSRRFFRQWLTRPGGPTPRLERVAAKANPAGGYDVTVVVGQGGQPYLLRLTLAVETEAGQTATTFVMDSRRHTASLTVPARPLRAVLDPGADCFRLLDAAESPPTVNAVKASRALTVLVADDAPESLQAAVPRLLAGLGQEGARLIRESALDGPAVAALGQGDVLVVGRPRVAVEGMVDALALSPESDTAFAVVKRGQGIAAAFTARPEAAAKDVEAAAGKVTHYGSFGIVGFKEGKNVRKSTPEPADSPLIKTF
ncbi:M1 family metallopeptidase [Solidesulfovibrio magneticus]|uniref:Peptidase M1 membrane alanine aminopeptidase domain-containing protein n=1 Tax=Solidesulfovibrio magneticus (strain ATCC 700980 / DSM 13731 / RS-1) TaxID=573370 RepID=C4XS58_SOLM1|nr:M1 family aminopeptidase [Solidesulfovibrio magneticus]BAH75580.1 hypothetical protein DMR_20890 [Solidesulfovibrio magneticus RS-1]